eukprot:316357-Prorocentrum_minimum.AAC.1
MDRYNGKRDLTWTDPTTSATSHGSIQRQAGPHVDRSNDGRDLTWTDSNDRRDLTWTDPTTGATS